MDTRLLSLQWFGNLFGHENVRVLLNETVQLARFLEYTHVRWQIETYCWTIQSLQLDSIRLAANFQSQAMALHDTTYGVLFHSRTWHLLSQVYFVDSATAFSMPWSPHFHVACGRCSHARNVWVFGQSVREYWKSFDLEKINKIWI